MNYRYGKLENEILTYAPNSLVIDGILHSNPRKEHYLSQGWLPVIDEKPEERLGIRWIACGWKIDGGEIHRVYKEDPIVAPPVFNRRWTKMKLKLALATVGWLQQVEDILDRIELAPGYSAKKAFQDCDYVEERWPDEERWNSMLDEMAAQLSKTRDEIDVFLDGVPTDNGEVR